MNQSINVKISVNKVEKLLEKAQSRSRSRNLSVDDVLSRIKALQQRLDEILFKKDQFGIVAYLTIYRYAVFL